MERASWRDGSLHVEDLPLTDLAERFGTPLYVYSHAAITEAARSLRDAFSSHPTLIAYSIKANSNLAVVRALAQEGIGADVVSGGELERALRAGVPADQIIFSGVGKTRAELTAALDAGIRLFNVEVEDELPLLSRLAQERGVRAPVALRINPDVDAKTHDYISTGRAADKFGFPLAEARDLYRRASDMPGLRVRGVHCHIGSQLTELEPFVEAYQRIRELVLALREDGISLDLIDAGGGLGVRYHDETPPSFAAYAKVVLDAFGDLDATLVLEPGRALVANAGLLLTEVLYRKRSYGKHFVVVDAAMNDLLRPSLYEAYHEIRAVRQTEGRVLADVVGPVCETGDFLAKDREVPDLRAGDLVAVMSAGAYGASMGSTYNSRPRPAEVLVRGSRAELVRERDTLDDLLAKEHIPESL